MALSLPLASTLALVALAAPQDAPVRGVVLDPEGRPAPHVQVAASWVFDHGAWMGHPLGGTTTDDRGRFELPGSGRPLPVLALDRASQLGALACWDPADPAALELRLGPAGKVSGKLDCSALGGAPAWTNVYVHAVCGERRLRVGQCSSDGAEFAFLLPGGSFELMCYGTDTLQRSEALEAPGAALELGTLDLEPTVLATLYGHPAPELAPTAARGIDPGTRLADLRGRHVLLEFWGFG